MPLYNESITIHRFGSFDRGAMERSVNEILRRHEAWRTAFVEEDGELVQRVREHRDIVLPYRRCQPSARSRTRRRRAGDRPGGCAPRDRPERRAAVPRAHRQARRRQSPALFHAPPHHLRRRRDLSRDRARAGQTVRRLRARRAFAAADAGAAIWRLCDLAAGASQERADPEARSIIGAVRWPTRRPSSNWSATAPSRRGRPMPGRWKCSRSRTT